MLLQVSVSHCVRGGMYASLHAGKHLSGQTLPLAGSPMGRQPPGQTPSLGRHPRTDTPGQIPRRILRDTVGGTHPTGMHTC